MQDEDKLYLCMRELNRLASKGRLSHGGMEQLLQPLAGLNEKQQDEYAIELLSVLRSSEDEEEMLVRGRMCLQLMAEDSVLDKKIEDGTREKEAVDDEMEEDVDGVRRETLVRQKVEQPQKDTTRRTTIDKEESSPRYYYASSNVYLTRFSLPIMQEEHLLEELGAYNGGKFAYVDNAYPCGIFDVKELSEVTFSGITIFYGGNGSGKSTLLNLIANRLELNRVAPYNTGEMFDRYRDACEYALGVDEEGFPLRIPSGSRIITSDDVFDYMLTMRTRNDEISEKKQAVREDYAKLKFGENVKFRGMEDYEALRLQVLARSKSVSRRKFIQRTAGEEVKLNSNGETALEYFRTKVKSKTLYCLDEPENSLSPAMQLELVKLLEQRVYEEECQLIIATHSPFLLAMNGAMVYDLDAVPAQVRPWWELENTKIYYEFFRKHRGLFE